jgi:hypothetical protein
VVFIASELEGLDTIDRDQADDLKIQTATMRVWVRRRVDGQPYDGRVVVERMQDGRWVITDEHFD